MGNKEKAVKIALKVVYWMVKENIALVKYKPLIQLLKSVGVTDLDYLAPSEGISYDTDYAVHEFLDALNETVEIMKLLKMKQEI